MEQTRVNIVSISADTVDPREPSTRCDRCGNLGTIARATRHSEPPLVLHYCAECWPTASKELEARQEEELNQSRISMRQSPDDAISPPAWTAASRSWYDVLLFLELMRKAANAGQTLTGEQLVSLASEIRATASEMSGEMPPEVEDFIRRY
jgi:hypothetical protein